PVFRKGDEAVADVARGHDAIETAQATRAAAIVGHGDDRGEPLPVETAGGGGMPGEEDSLQALEHDGEAGPAPQGDRPNAGRGFPPFSGERLRRRRAGRDLHPPPPRAPGAAHADRIVEDLDVAEAAAPEPA